MGNNSRCAVKQIVPYLPSCIFNTIYNLQKGAQISPPVEAHIQDNFNEAGSPLLHVTDGLS